MPNISRRATHLKVENAYTFIHQRWDSSNTTERTLGVLYMPKYNDSRQIHESTMSWTNASEHGLVEPHGEREGTMSLQTLPSIDS